MLDGYHLILRRIEQEYIVREIDIPRENLSVGIWNDMGSIALPVKMMYIYPERVDYTRVELNKTLSAINPDKPYLGPALGEV